MVFMASSSLPAIEKVSPEQAEQVLPALIRLLQDSVEAGASIGFLPPLSEEEARAYWLDVLDGVAQQARVLLVAWENGQALGTVQLELAMKANGRHRAEVQKLFVFTQQRQRGLGRRLMQAIEEAAQECGRSLLVLDTRQGDIAEQLYRKIGYTEVGSIPAYALGATGELQATVYFYKLLSPLAEKS